MSRLKSLSLSLFLSLFHVVFFLPSGSASKRGRIGVLQAQRRMCAFPFFPSLNGYSRKNKTKFEFESYEIECIQRFLRPVSRRIYPTIVIHHLESFFLQRCYDDSKKNYKKSESNSHSSYHALNGVRAEFRMHKSSNHFWISK